MGYPADRLNIAGGDGGDRVLQALADRFGASRGRVSSETSSCCREVGGVDSLLPTPYCWGGVPSPFVFDLTSLPLGKVVGTGSVTIFSIISSYRFKLLF